jgi:hypothetical protein
MGQPTKGRKGENALFTKRAKKVVPKLSPLSIL